MYLLEHNDFKAQLCTNRSNFKEMLNIDIVINLCLGASLMNSVAAGSCQGRPAKC